MKISEINITVIKTFHFLIFGYIPKKSNKHVVSILNNNNLKEFFLEKNFRFLPSSFGEFQLYFFQDKSKKKLIYNSEKVLLERISNKHIKNEIIGETTRLKFCNKKKKEFILKKILINPRVRYLDFAGINRLICQIQEAIEWPLRFYKIYEKSNISSVRGILLHGQPGTGKTLLAHVIAGELNIPILHFSPSSFVSSISGYSEKKIQNAFDYAEKNAPCIFFIDEIDGMAQSREHVTKETERKIIGQLLVSIDSIRMKKNAPVFVIAATNQIETIDQALRRPGRFDHEINLNIPTEKERFLILNHFTKFLKLCKKIDLNYIAKKTRGYVSGDLSALIKNVAILALSRVCSTIFKGRFRIKFSKISINFTINLIDFERGLIKTEPVLLRNGFINIHQIFWDQIGALNFVRMVLSKYIIEPIRNSVNLDYERNKGIGILLYGPPGCGKTLIAQATASESGANYICIKGPEIFDKFLGESEKTIRLIFNRARSCAPTIIFLDEIDSISSKRSNDESTLNNGASDRVVNQLLTEMDGINKKEPVYIIGATNRPEVIDKAILRPGRIDKLLFVPFPNKKEKIQILRTLSKKLSVLPYLNFDFLSQIMPQNYSGADLMSLTKEAILINCEIKLNYVLLENTTNGLFNVSKYFISTKDYLLGFKKMKGFGILKTKN
jgi:SpoVK/Ycf46/Vps4 family AAA+-type ATPase